MCQVLMNSVDWEPRHEQGIILLQDGERMIIKELKLALTGELMDRREAIVAMGMVKVLQKGVMEGILMTLGIIREKEVGVNVSNEHLKQLIKGTFEIGEFAPNHEPYVEERDWIQKSVRNHGQYNISLQKKSRELRGFKAQNCSDLLGRR